MLAAAEKKRLAEDALQLTQDMLQAAQAGRWETLEAMQEARAAVLASVFQTPTPLGADCVGLLEQTWTLNNLLLEWAAQERAALLHELSIMSQGRKASSAYAEAAAQ
jgi:hypothetical protein